jgi:hypothetical protein
MKIDPFTIQILVVVAPQIIAGIFTVAGIIVQHYFNKKLRDGSQMGNKLLRTKAH